MAIDTSRTLQIPGASLKLAGLLLASIAMTAASALVLFLDFEPDPAAFVWKVIGGIGTAFFGLCTLGWAWRLYRGNEAVVTISPAGLRDTRVAAKFIAWNAVRSLSTWSMAKASRGPYWSAR